MTHTLEVITIFVTLLYVHTTKRFHTSLIPTKRDHIRKYIYMYLFLPSGNHLEIGHIYKNLFYNKKCDSKVQYRGKKKRGDAWSILFTFTPPFILVSASAIHVLCSYCSTAQVITAVYTHYNFIANDSNVYYGYNFTHNTHSCRERKRWKYLICSIARSCL